MEVRWLAVSLLVASCSSDNSVVFVTRTEYGGDLKTFGGEPTGLESADGLCMLEARAAELRGSFRAWLSSSTVNAIDRIVDDSPWDMVGGTTVFENLDALAAGPSAGITRDQFGKEVVVMFGLPVWTGTLSAGTTSQYTCMDWTNALCSPRRADQLDQVPAADPNTGSIGAGGDKAGAWTYGNGCIGTCPMTARLYCFEQPPGS